MIKSRANEGILAPGFKSLSFAERRDLKNVSSPLRVSYNNMGSAFLKAYSHQLNQFSVHFLENEKRTMVRAVK
jgi:hypothetical protein